MPNRINVAIANEYEDLLHEDLEALFVQPVGLTVMQATSLRNALREAALSMHLVRSRLALRQLEAQGLTGTAPIFEGPAAVIVGDDGQDGTAITAAKAVAAWRKEHKLDLPAIKGGVLEGQVLVGEAARALETMPGREEVMATLSGQILAPGRRLASQLTAPGGRIASALETIIGKQEDAD